jgi:hypothetical protein
MKVHGVIDVRQTKICAAEPLVPEPNDFVFEMVIENLKRHNQVLIKCQQNSLQQGVEEFSQIHKLTNSGIMKICQRSGRSCSLYLSVRRVVKQIVVVTVAYHIWRLFYHHPSVKVYSICRGNYCVSSVWISMQPINYCAYI